MQGTIKTFLPEKRYGFIKGDDGRDYFFHLDEFKNLSDHNNLCEGSLVGFDQQATPKGYKARKCFLVDATGVTTYVVPDEFITSRSGSVSGWEVIEGGQWVVIGTSRDSPELAKRDAQGKAFQQLGANALLFLEYYKSRGSEPGTGRGTYYFTIHHYRGVAAILAKKSAHGKYPLEDLKGLNQRAGKMEDRLGENKRIAKRNALLWGSVLSVLSIVLIAGAGMLGVFLAIALWLLFQNANRQDYDWLQRL
jgi:cold shock CspA family protein